MARTNSVFQCAGCGATTLKWAGRCLACGEWNTIFGHERAVDEGRATRVSFCDRERSTVARAMTEVESATAWPIPTGLSELDRVLAGGFVPGSVTLLGGEPGTGKSTLVLQAALAIAASGRPALIIAAEESAEQVRCRADRIGTVNELCFVLSTGDLGRAIDAAVATEPALVVIDSIQALADPAVSSSPGSVSQVRDCAQALAEYAKATSTATVLVGHVTKDGSLAGPRTLEHLVDTVLSFDGDRHYALRALTAVKHRYGPAGELGLFEMGEQGLANLDDPSRLLLGDRRPDAAGSVATSTVEGRRPIVVEVQALLGSAASGATPRRIAQGVTQSRLIVLLAVLERCGGYRVGGADVFVSTVGGLRVSEPAADLAVAAAVCSSLTGVPVPTDTVVFGEVGLSGEVRQVPGVERRISEAARLGFLRVIAPEATPEVPVGSGIRLERVRTVAEALDLMGFPAGPSLMGSASTTGFYSGQARRRVGTAGEPAHLVVLAPLADTQAQAVGSS